MKLFQLLLLFFLFQSTMTFSQDVGTKDNVYTGVEDFKNGFARVWNQNKCGFINKKGKLVIPLKYDAAGDFVEGLAWVELNEKRGYINMEGEVVIPMIFFDARNFSEGLARVQKKGQFGWSYIDKTGKIVLPQQNTVEYYYIEAEDFSDGLASLRLHSKNMPMREVYIDKEGNVVIIMNTVNLHKYKFHEGFATVNIYSKDGSKSIFINKKGEPSFNKQFDNIIEPFKDGIAKVRIEDKEYYINKNGQFVNDTRIHWKEPKVSLDVLAKIPGAYPYEVEFIEGFATVTNGEFYTFIDKNGKLLFPLPPVTPKPPKAALLDDPNFFDNVWKFEQGFAAVQNYNDGSAWGYIDTSHTLVIPRQYSRVSNFFSGKAFVVENGIQKFIDTKGNKVQGLDYDEFTPIPKTGFAIVGKSNKYGLVNKEWKEVIPLKYAQIWTINFGLLRYKIENNGKWGLIDTLGNELCPPKFDEIGDLINGVSIVKLNQKSGYLDISGFEIAPPIYDKVYEFKCGVGRVENIENEKKWAYINKKGQVIVPLTKYYLGDFSEDIGVHYNESGLAGGIDSLGNIVVAFKYKNLSKFQEGVAVGSTTSYEDVIVYKNGFEQVLKKGYSISSIFWNGLLQVQDSKRNLCFINKQGLEIYTLPPNREMKSYKNGIIFLYDKDTKKYGAIDTLGKEVLPFEFDKFEFTRLSTVEYIKTYLGEKVGLMNLNGQIILPIKYDAIDYFNKDYVNVKYNNKWGLMDFNGKEVLECKYDGNIKVFGLNSDWGFSVMLNGRAIVIDNNGKCVRNCL